jgi:tetratricopeptide (TPR) repeat protein
MGALYATADKCCKGILRENAEGKICGSDRVAECRIIMREGEAPRWGWRSGRGLCLSASSCMNAAQPKSFFKVPVQMLAIGVIMAAIFMGGATQRVPQAIVFAAMGVLMIAAPPASWPDRKWMFAVLGLLLLAAAGALPSGWFHAAPWRNAVRDAGIALPATLSPQPRLTLEAWLLFATGIAWLGWLMASPRDAPSCRLAAKCLTCGLTVLAVFVLVQWFTGWRPPGWLSAEGHGPFPNRNHTAHVLALGGVLAVGCAADAARRGLMRTLPWLLAACVILAALAATYSRGGIVMFFSALGLWNVSVAWTRRSWKILLLGLAALCVVASAVLVFGGPIAGRFAGGVNSGVSFRFRIWSDASALIDASPWCGAGLGNFRALFPFFRTASVIQSSVIHPESDWLWLAAEAGWFAVALAFVALGFAAAGAFPIERGTQRRLRCAALAAAVAAVLHGLVDVPGHRLGSVLAALFVLALARRDAVPRASRVAPAAWRALGLALVALAAWWLNVPDDAARAETLSRAGNFAEATQCASRAIGRAPLDWRPYFTRAVALACSGKVIEAVEDFHRARLLEPHYAKIPLEEGRFWLRLQPELALVAWQEALRRSSEPEVVEIFALMCSFAPDNAAFRARLLDIAEGHDALKIDWFLNAPAEEVTPHVAEFAPLAERSDPHRRAAFARRAAEIVPPAKQ